jgi:hypothetical protein
MTIFGAGEGAACEHADDDHAHARAAAMVEQALEVLCGKSAG